MGIGEDKDTGTTGGFRVGNSSPVSFEMQREAARRASDVKKMILGECLCSFFGIYLVVVNCCYGAISFVSHRECMS